MDELTVEGWMHLTMKLAMCIAPTYLLSVGIVTATAVAAPADPMYRIAQVGDSCAEGSALNSSGQVTGSTDCSTARAFFWSSDGGLRNIDTLAKVHTGSVGYALNSAGQVTGGVWITSDTPHVFLWKNDGTRMIDLGTLGGAFGIGFAINDSGQIAGGAYTGAGGEHAFVWQNDGHPLRDLGTLGGVISEASAINASGQVTGWADTGALQDQSHAFLWKNDGTPMVDLGTLGGTSSSGVAINDSGQVTGISKRRLGQPHAFLWRNDGTPMIDLGTLGGPNSSPTGLNSSGQVIGTSTTLVNGARQGRAFVWRNDGSRMLNLGTLGGVYSGGLAINDSGWAVGTAYTATQVPHAFLWKDDGKGMRDLNDLVDPADPLKPYILLSSAEAINDAGDIMAFGKDSRNGFLQYTYLLRGSSLALSPRSLAFANQQVGTTSAAKSITVQNNTTAVVPITSIALKGVAAAQFASTNNCGSSLVGHASCTIKVTFKPTSKGAKSATLNVNGGGGGLRVVSLTGAGT